LPERASLSDQKCTSWSVLWHSWRCFLSPP
jgi:hypothetical protein